VSEHHFYSRCIPDGRRFVRVGLRQFNPHLPHATLVKTCRKEPRWLTAKWTHHIYPETFWEKLTCIRSTEKLQAFSFFVHLAHNFTIPDTTMNTAAFLHIINFYIDAVIYYWFSYNANMLSYSVGTCWFNLYRAGSELVGRETRVLGY
jgi:hypothetical protein